PGSPGAVGSGPFRPPGGHGGPWGPARPGPHRHPLGPGGRDARASGTRPLGGPLRPPHTPLAGGRAALPPAGLGRPGPGLDRPGLGRDPAEAGAAGGRGAGGAGPPGGIRPGPKPRWFGRRGMVYSSSAGRGVGGGSTVSGLPRVVIVGRPDVGESTLFDRMVRRRVALVHDEPGVTRDPLEAVVEWAGRRFLLVDTGGYDPRSPEPVGPQVVAKVQE